MNVLFVKLHCSLFEFWHLSGIGLAKIQIATGAMLGSNAAELGTNQKPIK